MYIIFLNNFFLENVIWKNEKKFIFKKIQTLFCANFTSELAHKFKPKKRAETEMRGQLLLCVAVGNLAPTRPTALSPAQIGR